MLLSRGFLTGLLFVVIGGGAAFIASAYRLGTPEEMGPGFFPVLLGSVIAVNGVVIALRGLIDRRSADVVTDVRLRPILVVLAAIASFGLLIEPFGLLPALVAVIAIARLARIEGGVIDLILTLIVVTAIPVAVFIYGLSLPIPLWTP